MLNSPQRRWDCIRKSSNTRGVNCKVCWTQWGFQTINRHVYVYVYVPFSLCIHAKLIHKQKWKTEYLLTKTSITCILQLCIAQNIMYHRLLHGASGETLVKPNHWMRYLKRITTAYFSIFSLYYNEIYMLQTKTSILYISTTHTLIISPP